MEVKLYILLIISFLSFCSLSVAQNFLNWNQGKLVLNNQKILEGEICYGYYPNEIWFRKGRFFKSYYAQNIQSFDFFDTQLNLKRYFVIHVGLNRQKTIFEMLLPGKYQLLKEVKKTYNFANSRKEEYYTSNTNFFCWDGRKMYKVKHYNHQLRELFSKNGLDLKKIISKLKLNLYKLQDRLKLFTELNLAAAQKSNFSANNTK